jgi:transcriptional accessory protein Tex/SPT6
MALILPLLAGSIGSLGGFVAGYYINQPVKNSNQIQTNIEMKNMTYNEINYELINFDKSKLKPVIQLKLLPTLEQEIMETLRQKIENRRISIVY